jgi:ABC-type polysaccharide/polyol phosphate export permease
VVPAVALLIVYCWATTALCAITNVFFSDTQHLAEVGFGIWFFLTPIIYPKERLTERGLGLLADLNPVVAFLDTIRDPLLTGVPPSTAAFGNAFGMTFVAVTTAVATFAALERRVVFHL